MTVRIAVDPNVCTGGFRPIAGYEDLQAQRLLSRARLADADGPVSVGDDVLAVELEDRIVTTARVVDIQEDLGMVYLAVARRGWRDDPEAAEDPICE